MMTFARWTCGIVAVLLGLATLGANPGAREDEAAARLKLMRAADQLDVQQAEMDAVKAQADQLRQELNALKTELASLRSENTVVRSDILALKTAIEKLEAARAKEREVLIGEISKLIADATKSAPAPASSQKKEEVKPKPAPPAPEPEPASAPAAPQGEAQAGYYYTVKRGDTLWSIVEAYRSQGVNVTLAEVMQANNIAKGQTLHTGQQIFIPKK